MGFTSRFGHLQLFAGSFCSFVGSLRSFVGGLWSFVDICNRLQLVCGRLWSLPLLVVYLVVVVYCCIFHQKLLWSTSIILLRISSSIPLKVKLVVIYTGQDLVEKFAGKPDWYLDCKLFLCKYSCISMCLVFSVKLNTAHNSEIFLRNLEKQITLLTNFPD